MKVCVLVAQSLHQVGGLADGFVGDPAWVLGSRDEMYRKTWVRHLPAFRTVAILHQIQQILETVDCECEHAVRVFVVGFQSVLVGAYPCGWIALILKRLVEGAERQILEKGGTVMLSFEQPDQAGQQASRAAGRIVARASADEQSVDAVIVTLCDERTAIDPMLCPNSVYGNAG